MKKILLAQFLIFLGTSVLSFQARAFEVVNEKLTYLGNRHLMLGAGFGFVGLLQEKGIQGDTGFGMRVFAGHHFNRFLEGQIVYQYSMFDITSPDPVAVTSQLKTGADMNQEYFRFVLQYPSLLIQPMLSVGFGGYNLFAVNSETALSFSTQMMVPVSGGFRAYYYKDIASLDVEFSYQWLFGVNQNASTLALLGLSEVDFNAYSLSISTTFHFL